jgi:hypothetical protein
VNGEIMEDPLKTIQRQTQRYWYVDGLNEIGGRDVRFAAGPVLFAAGAYRAQRCR